MDATSAAYIPGFISHLSSERRLSALTAVSYRHDLRTFCEFCGTQTLTEWSQVDSFHVRSFAAAEDFATERVLATLHLLGAGLLYLVTRATSFGAVYAIMLAYCICYFPTIALTNSLTTDWARAKWWAISPTVSGPLMARCRRTPSTPSS